MYIYISGPYNTAHIYICTHTHTHTHTHRTVADAARAHVQQLAQPVSRSQKQKSVLYKVTI